MLSYDIMSIITLLGKLFQLAICLARGNHVFQCASLMATILYLDEVYI